MPLCRRLHYTLNTLRMVQVNVELVKLICVEKKCFVTIIKIKGSSESAKQT